MEHQMVVQKKRKLFHVLIDMLTEMRIKQWTKNLLVFASAIFSGAFLDPGILLKAFLAFLSFSFMASTIYIINDIVDVDKDRLHPEKRYRPIASGAINIPVSIILLLFTFLIAVGIAISINSHVLIAVLVYFVMNLSYSLYLKHIVIIDVMIIAAGFVLRAVTGAIAVDGLLTSWFILCTLGLSLFLALGKRRHELLLLKNKQISQRKVLKFYSVELLDQLMTVITGVLIMFYSMYCYSEGTAMMFTIPFVLYGIFRYYYLIHMENAGGKPEEVLLNDKHILVTVILFSILVVIIKNFT
ncbi:decaprenyl-phosphate phosphoribosyltransferase [Paenibacillus sp. PDC88]|uniref:decaprenyl-phosphate phosphoribosyltransferase n=1 Tax=Paenibacillus sp. PDC88 TaxID=1884375 RepID=UPI00089A4CE2|nr:decaprenyl-phosphate phosphoribosyltransferase [Paenibacillus sp. PDC88]SDW82309.1 4-hydroxybenzoate polyprenyltransferase [Paenibacillus sp. PDC88]